VHVGRHARVNVGSVHENESMHKSMAVCEIICMDLCMRECK